MLQSMTGFGTKTVTLTGESEEVSHISMTLKSLNSRFFEATCRMPYAFSHLETDIIASFKKRLRRGHLYFTIHMSNSDIFKRSVEPALATINAYSDAIKKIKENLSIETPLTIDHIIRLPNIFSVVEQVADKESQQKLIHAIGELTEQVIASRVQEGKDIMKDLTERLAAVKNKIKTIKKQSLIVLENQKKKIHEAVQEIGNNEDALAEARKSALYTMLDKIDIHEEITRIYSHLEKFETHLTSDEVEKGKRLDFVLQELAREINTIAAKCSDATIGADAIDMKVEIEKMREQVQNIV